MEKRKAKGLTIAMAVNIFGFFSPNVFRAGQMRFERIIVYDCGLMIADAIPDADNRLRTSC